MSAKESQVLKRVMVINGPNLGRLGRREPEIYGTTTHEELALICRQAASSLGWEADVRQSDSEAELIGWLHEAADAGMPVVLNAAAFTHYSLAIGDACAQLTAPMIEVHMSNPAAREEFRHLSVVSRYAAGVISGFGVGSYLLALRALAGLVA